MSLIQGDAPHNEAILFGPFRLIPAERLLLRGSEAVQIGSRALDVLMALVEVAGDVVSQRKLMARAWPNVVVGDGSLRVTIAELRKLLGDGQNGVRYITNVTGRGYCFVAAVERAPALESTPPVLPAMLLPRHRLPPRLSRIVGRDETIRSLADLLRSTRFVSVVGPGGMGKTAVAITLAHAFLDEFAYAVYFIDLGSLTATRLLTSAVAAELGVGTPTEDVLPGVIAFLAQRRALLILDNCEHVIDAVASLAEQIYREAPQVHILATTREALRAGGEQVYLLSPLEHPSDKDGLTAEEAMESPAVQLFMDRAFASGHTSPLTNLEAPIVATICRRLDGIALAIELAGSRVGAYGLQGTADLLSNRFRLFWQGRRSAPPRHQTLHAMLDWSFNLLSENDRSVLTRLSVFVGPFTLAAAQAIASDSEISEREIADAVASLVGKSLLSVARSQGTPVYRLLDPTLAYAADKLARHTDASAVARRHALHFTAWSATAAPDSYFMLGRGVSATTEAHMGNIRAALEWSFSSDGEREIGLQLAATAVPLFFGLSSLAECRRWCEAGLAVVPATHAADKVRLILQATLAAVGMFTLGNEAEILQSIEDCLLLAEKLDDKVHQLHLLAGLHIFHVRSCDCAASVAVAQRCMLIAEEIGSTQARAMAEFMLGVSHHIAGDQAVARLHCERGLAESASLGSAQMVFFGYDQRVRALHVLARSLWLSGLPDQAAAMAQAAVDEAETQNHPVIMCMSLIYSITVFLWNGDLAHARSLIDQLIGHASTHSLQPYQNVALALSGELAIKSGDLEEGIPLLKQALSLLQGKHYYTLCLHIHSIIADALLALDRDADALAFLDSASSRTYATENDNYAPELLRLRGELYQRSIQKMPMAEAAFQLAIRTARSQSALSFELRSAMSLARLWASTGRIKEAKELLQNVYERFSEGFRTTDLCAARRLLEDLDRDVAANAMGAATVSYPIS